MENNKATSSISLCPECAPLYLNPQAAEQSQPAVLKEVFDLFNTFIAAAEGQVEAPPKSAAVEAMPTCPKCGITLREVIEGGRLGCPACYDNFQVTGLLKNLQNGAEKHVGKVPSQWKKKQKDSLQTKKRKIPIELRIKGLELKMAAMISQEKYETAVVLKKYISDMTKLKSELDLLRAAMVTASKQKNKSYAEDVKKQMDEIMDKCADMESTIGSALRAVE